MDDEKMEQLIAAMVHLTKRIERLEGRRRLAPASTYVSELEREAERILRELRG